MSSSVRVQADGRFRRTASRAAVGCLLLAAAASCAPKPGSASQLPNVVVILVDALRADHIGAYGYARETTPTFDRLAAEGVLFESAIATASRTRPSVASLFTSLHPQEHGVRNRMERGASGLRIESLQEEHLTMAEAYEEAGYETMAVVTNPYLKGSHGFSQGFSHYFEGDLDADQVVDTFTEWLATAPDRPFFCFLHFIDVHWPYAPPAPYDTMFVQEPGPGGLAEVRDWFELRRRIRSGEIVLDEADLAELIARYDGELRRVDDASGRILGALERANDLQKTLVVVVADHGDEFMEHGRLGHGFTLYDGLVRVPLILRLPGGEHAGLRLSGTVSLVDLMPTLLELSDVPLPPELSGRSRAEWLRTPPGAGEPAFSEMVKGSLRKESVRTDRYKLIRTIDGKGKGAGNPEEQIGMELYDLSVDPGEQEDLSVTLPEVTAELEALLSRHVLAASGHKRATPEMRAIDPEMEERLRSLGYVQ